MQEKKIHIAFSVRIEKKRSNGSLLRIWARFTKLRNNKKILILRSFVKRRPDVQQTHEIFL